MGAMWLCAAGCLPAYHVVRDGSEYVGLDPASSPEEWADYDSVAAGKQTAPAPPRVNAKAAAGRVSSAAAAQAPSAVAENGPQQVAPAEERAAVTPPSAELAGGAAPPAGNAAAERSGEESAATEPGKSASAQDFVDALHAAMKQPEDEAAGIGGSGDSEQEPPASEE
jgi:hypothetical protein